MIRKSILSWIVIATILLLLYYIEVITAEIVISNLIGVTAGIIAMMAGYGNFKKNG